MDQKIKVYSKSIHNKKKTKRKKGIIVFMRLIFITIICTMLFLVLKTATEGRKEFISTSNISYYIDIADEYSKPNQQLNWKEIAAIYGVVVAGDFDKHKDATLKGIASDFYGRKMSGGKYELLDFDSVIAKQGFNKKQIKRAYNNLERLDTISIRGEIEGKKEKKDSFINSLKKDSISMYKKYGIFPSVSIGQAILESDWGNSSLAKDYKNYFGIKADKSWKGRLVTLTTKENHNDIIKDKFRVYSSVGESIDDLGEFLTNNPRYKENGVFDAKNYREQVQALEDAGYSTAKNESGEKIYADLLIDIIKENNLMLIDYEANK